MSKTTIATLLTRKNIPTHLFAIFFGIKSGNATKHETGGGINYNTAVPTINASHSYKQYLMDFYDPKICFSGCV